MNDLIHTAVVSDWSDIKLPLDTQMSLMASQYQAISLSQGFLQFDTTEHLKAAINQAFINDKNQHCLSSGWPDWFKQIWALVQSFIPKDEENRLEALNTMACILGSTHPVSLVPFLAGIKKTHHLRHYYYLIRPINTFFIQPMYWWL